MRNVCVVCLLLASFAIAQQSSPVTVRVLNIYDPAHRLAASEEQTIIADVRGASYPADGLSEIAEQVRYGYQKYGFFKALVSSPDTVFLNPQRVDVTVEVDAGEQYRLSNLSLKGRRVLSATELRSKFAIRDGEVFNVEKIRVGLETLRSLYANSGYINMVPVPDTFPNDETRTVSVMIELDEGRQFRVGRLIINGDEKPEPWQKERLLKAWKQYEGQVYDSEFVRRFLHDNASILPAGVENRAEIITTTSGLVDVALEIPDNTPAR